MNTTCRNMILIQKTLVHIGVFGLVTFFVVQVLMKDTKQIVYLY